MRSPRWEIVRSDAGFFARFIASNGKEIVRSSEVYVRRRGALRAIELVTGRRALLSESGSYWLTGWDSACHSQVRDVDERTTP